MTGVTPDEELVRITTDIGEILGVDGRDYDFREGDVVRLPAVNATPLVEKDAAVRLDGFDPSPANSSASSASIAEAEAVVGFEPPERRPAPAHQTLFLPIFGVSSF